MSTKETNLVTSRFNSETGKKAGSKPRRPKKRMLYKYQHIADAAGVSVYVLKHAIKNGEIDVNNLVSISYYIVRKTLTIPQKIEKIEKGEKNNES